MGAGVRWPVAVAITFALVAAACSSGGGTGSNASPNVSVTPKVAKEPTSPVTISFAAPGYIINSPQVKKFAKDFEQLHPNITIQFQSVPADTEEAKLTTQIAAGAARQTALQDPQTRDHSLPRAAPARAA